MLPCLPLAHAHYLAYHHPRPKLIFCPYLSVFFLQGGFGQVLEVVKRDCGKRYAMKVMHKEMMRRCLGSSWRKKIWLEKDLMASLSHPLLVNLLYAFQNQAS
jgi:serine/threonine protein kinase